MYGHYFVSLVGFLSCIIFVLRLLHVQHHPRVMVVVCKKYSGPLHDFQHNFVLTR